MTESPSSVYATASRLRVAAVYTTAAVLPAAVAVTIALVQPHGSGSSATTPAPHATVSLARLLLAAVVVVFVGHLGRVFAARLGQPRAVGQLVAGIALGPSILGWLLPWVENYTFPPGVSALLWYPSQAGVVLFMFLVGQELSLPAIRATGRTALVLGHSMMAVPLLGGALLALGMLHRGAVTTARPVAFVLFVALSMSITAFPVLAHILRERGMLRDNLGVLAISTAAVGDVTAWCLLAGAVAAARYQSLAAAIAVPAVLVVIVVAAAWFGGRGLAKRIAALPAAVVPVFVITGVCAFAYLTNRIGVHPIFGAFLFGLLLPHSAPIEAFANRINGVTEWLLLPFFFVTVGLQTRAVAVLNWAGLALCAAVLAVAMATKWLGTAPVARLLNVGWRDGIVLGAMLDCRGLTELVVLQIAVSVGIFDQRLMATMVIMTLLTTALTGPLIGYLRRGD